jgi:two-component sensor histidine kinase
LQHDQEKEEMTQYTSASCDCSIQEHTHEGTPEQPFSEELLVLREFTHRVNNELASAIAAISLVAKRSPHGEVKVTLERVLNRLENYAKVHRALQVPTHGILVDAAAYFHLLCRSISLSKLNAEGIQLVLIECPLQLHSEQCWRLGMIVSELITNSARHAFSERGGTIEVEIVQRDNFARCRVADDGAGAATIRQGQGLSIIEGLVRGLGGKIDQQFTAHGTTSVVTFPLRLPAPLAAGNIEGMSAPRAKAYRGPAITFNKS